MVSFYFPCDDDGVEPLFFKSGICRDELFCILSCRNAPSLFFSGQREDTCCGLLLCQVPEDSSSREKSSSFGLTRWRHNSRASIRDTFSHIHTQENREKKKKEKKYIPHTQDRICITSGKVKGGILFCNLLRVVLSRLQSSRQILGIARKVPHTHTHTDIWQMEAFWELWRREKKRRLRKRSAVAADNNYCALQ